MAAESIEEKEERRQRARERYTRTSREEPFKQCSVHLKMRRFHEHFTSLSSPMCSTCSESFPGIKLCTSTTMCVPRQTYTQDVLFHQPLPPQLPVSARVCIDY